MTDQSPPPSSCPVLIVLSADISPPRVHHTPNGPRPLSSTGLRPCSCSSSLMANLTIDLDRFVTAHGPLSSSSQLPAPSLLSWFSTTHQSAKHPYLSFALPYLTINLAWCNLICNHSLHRSAHTHPSAYSLTEPVSLTPSSETSLCSFSRLPAPSLPSSFFATRQTTKRAYPPLPLPVDFTFNLGWCDVTCNHSLHRSTHMYTSRSTCSRTQSASLTPSFETSLSSSTSHRSPLQDSLTVPGCSQSQPVPIHPNLLNYLYCFHFSCFCPLSPPWPSLHQWFMALFAPNYDPSRSVTVHATSSSLLRLPSLTSLSCSIFLELSLIIIW